MVFVLMGMALVAPARSAEWQSAYQDISVSACPDTNPRPLKQRSDHEATLRVCRPFLGYKVGLNEYPHRHELRVAPPGQGSTAATLAFLSGLGPRIEWRGPLRGAAISPRALIVRVGAADIGDEKAALLAILKVSPEAACLVGVVDVRTNPDANGVARREADRFTDGFSCNSPAEILGQSSAFAEAFIGRLR
jgi:hypothetical protein